MTALSASSHEVFWLRLERSGRIEETRALPRNITAVQWRDDDRALGLDEYPSIKSEFAKAVERINPDLIHAGPIQRVAYLATLIGFHPLLTMSWGFDLLDDAKRDKRWAEITRFVLERSDWFTSDCRTTRDLAVSYGMDPQRTTIFPWGVDLGLFNPERRGMMRRQVGYEEDLLIVHTRSWESRYGVDIALSGFWQAIQVEPHMRLFMFGGGSQEAMVKGFVEEKGLQDRILFSGYKQNEALAGYYQAADVYLSASHIDGSSVALLEAMACACPALVSDIPANLEWVQDRKQGWIFRDGQAGDLAQKFIHIARHRHEIIEKGRHARMTVEDRANWQKNTAVLLQTYQDLWQYHKNH